MDFLYLPDNILGNPSFMALINEASSVHANRLAARQNVAHRLRLLEQGDDQRGLENVEAVRQELREADDALHEALSMIEELKELVSKVSSETGLANLARASTYSSDDINSINSDRIM
jgi:hypothetical protein